MKKTRMNCFVTGTLILLLLTCLTACKARAEETEAASAAEFTVVSAAEETTAATEKSSEAAIQPKETQSEQPAQITAQTTVKPATPTEPAHIHEYTCTVTASTCTEKGYTAYSCSCGDNYRSNETNALGHSYQVTTVKPTATEKGYTLHACKNCNYSYKDNYVDATGSGSGSSTTTHTHNYKAVVTAPTCTKKGYTTYTCACGHSYQADETPMADHNYTKTVVAPTCTAQGYTNYVCKVCKNEYRDDVVKATGHNYVATVVAPTTTAQGYTLHTCKNCNDSYKDTYTEMLHSHKYTDTVVAPTCTAKGYTKHTCACGNTYSDSEKAALGHSYTTSVVAPTATAQGYTLHTCSRCNDSYKDNYTDKLPEPTKPTEPATCGHSYKPTDVIFPTCTLTGGRRWECTKCGHSYIEELPATGHNYTTSVVAPTTTAQGYTLHTCSRCNDSYKDNYTDKLPEPTKPTEPATCTHSYKPTLVVFPSCTEIGSRWWECTKCGYEYREELPATGHNWTVTEDDTTHTAYRCGNCGATKSEKKATDVYSLINAERAAAGLPALSYYSGGQEAADIRLSEIHEQFDHKMTHRPTPFGASRCVSFLGRAFCNAPFLAPALILPCLPLRRR